MVLLPGMSFLSNGRLDGGSQNEKNEQDRAEQKCAQSIHGQNLLRRIVQYQIGDGRHTGWPITVYHQQKWSVVSGQQDIRD